MKLRPFSLSLAGLVFLWSACSIVDPFTIAVNLPLEVCATVNDTGTAWRDSASFTLRDEVWKVSADYPDKVKATRVNDITVHMPNPPATGSGTGIISFALGDVPFDTLLTFVDLPFDSLGGDGMSLRSFLNSSRVDTAALRVLLTALQSPTGLPLARIRVATAGRTTVAVPRGTTLCARIHYQADVEIKN